MADDDYANVSSESSMGNYHSRDWGFLKFSDCWRENHGSSVCVRESVVISFSSFSELEALRLWPWWCLPNEGLCMFCFCFFILCRITPVAQEAEWWIFNLLLLCFFKVLYFILQKKHFCPAVSSLGYVRDCYRACPSLIFKLSHICFLPTCNYKWQLDARLDMINMETDTCRVLIFTQPLMRAG